MLCIVCKTSFSFLGDESRKIMYCSEYCRRKYYHDKKARGEISIFIRENKQEFLSRYTVKSLRKLGFKVLISELLFNNQEVIEENAS